MAASQLPQFVPLDCFQLVLEQIEQTLNQIQHSQIQLEEAEEAKFRSLFEQSADALMLARNGVIFDCNQAAVELFGWQDKTEFLPCHAAQLSPEYQPDGRASFEKAAEMIALAQQNGNHRFEWMHQRRDGEDFWTEILLTQIELDDKSIQYITLRDIRDRKQIETKLREVEKRFRVIFNQTFQLAGILSPDGILLEANQTSLDVIAAHPEDVIGKPFWETPWWAHSPRVQQQLQQAIAQAKAGQIASFEFDMPAPDGSIITLEFSIKPIVDSSGKVVMLIPEARNISDRKQAEAERLQAEATLREQEQFLRSIYDNVGNFIFVVDVLPNGNFHYVGWNAAGERGSGLSSEEISGKTPEEIFGEIEGAGDRQRLVQCVQQKHALTIEENLTFNGQSTWWITTYNPLCDQAGRVHRIVGTSFSITDRKSTEEALRQSEARFQELATNLPGMIYQFRRQADGSQSFTYVSPGCLDLHEVSAETFTQDANIGLEMVHPEDKALFMRSIALSAQTLQGWQQEYRIITPSGKIKWLQGHSQPKRLASGDIVWDGFLTDVSDRKRAEAALQQSEERLQLALSGSGDGLWDWDMIAGTTYFSSRWFTMLGYEVGELPNSYETWEMLIHPEDKPLVLNALQTHIDSGAAYELEFRMRTKSGDWKWIGGYGKVVARDAAGQPLRMAGTHKDISDRKLAEAELRKTQRQFQMLMDYAPAVIYIKDLEGKYLAVSRNYCEFFQKRPEEILDHNDHHVHPPAIADQIRSNDRAVIASRSGLALEETVIQPNGERSYISTKFAFKDEQGNPYALCGISFDISDRKRIEAALAASESQYRNLVETSQDLIWSVDTKGCYTFVNQAVKQIYGYEPEEMIGLSFTQFQAPECAQKDLEVFEKLLAGETISQYETVHINRNGERIYLQFNAIALYGESGQLLGTTGTASNITQRKRVEIALRESEQQLREQAQRERLLNQLTQQIRNSLDFDIALSTALTEIQAFLDVDRCQFAWYAPDAGEAYWEVMKEVCHPGLPDFTGRYPISIVGPLATKLLQLEILYVPDIETVTDPVWKTFVRSLKIRSVLIIPMKMPSGTIGVISCSHSSKPYDWKADEIELLKAVMGQLAIALNQADLYAQSRAKAHELEQTLHQLQRTQAQMLQSEKMSSLGQLVAGVAHEINNPVNFIYGNLNYASDYIEDLLGLVKLYQQQYPEPVAAVEAQAEAIDLDFLITDLPKLLNSMKVGANRIQKIVASLRTFSRMDEAEVKLVDLHEGIDSTLLILQHRIKRRDDRTAIEIIKNYENLPLIECYAGQLNQVFMNLLSNAIDALEDALKAKGDLIPTITIETKRIDRFVAIEITDNGLGISESVRQRLFDPFFTTKPLGKGTGMGLSISYQIVVEKHNGSIDCISSEAGTTFSVKIPACPASK